MDSLPLPAPADGFPFQRHIESKSDDGSQPLITNCNRAYFAKLLPRVNPFDRFKKYGERIFSKERQILRYLEADNIDRLLEVSPVYLQQIIKGAILTGLRKGDLLKIKWTDINLEKGQLIYYEQKKGEKIPRVKNLCQDMIDLLMGIPRKGEFVFLGPVGQPLKDVRRSFKAALLKAGIKNFRFHDLRHTSASQMLMRGASMRSVQEHLGHAKGATTERYAHLSEEYQKNQVQFLNGLIATSEKRVRNSDNQGKQEAVDFATA